MSPSEADRGRERRPDIAQAAHEDAQAAGSVTLGLVPAPMKPASVAAELADELPELLGRHIDERVSWNISVIRDPLTGAEAGASEILEEGRELMLQEGWDYAICLTDLPVRRKGRVIVADVSVERRVAGVSLPALGMTLLRRRLRESTIQLVSEMYWGSSEADRDREQRRQEADTGEGDGASAEASAGEANLSGGGSRQLVGRRLTERLAPIQRIKPDDETDVDVRFVAPRVVGRVRLLVGMVLANRPWRLFITMRGVLTAAFATGAYALIFPSIWQLSNAFGLARLVMLMLLSITVMIVWLIVAHELWERPTGRIAREDRNLARLYNSATGITLSVSVLLSYAALFALILAASWIFVPGGFLGSTLGEPVGPGSYATLAWITASVATIAGALGAGLEDSDTVRRAAYGYRQRRRTEEYQKRRRAEDSEDGSQSDGGPVTQG